MYFVRCCCYCSVAMHQKSKRYACLNAAMHIIIYFPFFFGFVVVVAANESENLREQKKVWMQNEKTECLQIKWYMVFLVAFNPSHVKYSIESDTFFPLKLYYIYLLHDERILFKGEKSMILLHKLMQFSARFHFRFRFFFFFLLFIS